MNAQTNIFAALTETNEVAASISNEIEAKKAAKATKKAAKPAKPAAEKKAKPATKKAAKPAAEAAQADISTANEFDADAVRLQYLAACERRKADAPACTSIDADISYFKGFIRGHSIDTVNKTLAFAHSKGLQVEKVAAMFAKLESEVSKDDYIGIKVITKVRSFYNALETGFLHKCDKYSYAILCNMIELNSAFSVHDMQRMNSRQIVSDDRLRNEKQIIKMNNSSAGTACSQTSSSRMMLGYMGILNVTKGKRDDAPEWLNTAAGRYVQQVYKTHCEN